MSPDSAPYHQVQQEIKGRANDGGTCWDYFGASNGEYDFSQVYE
jgi:hypothetical protein